MRIIIVLIFILFCIAILAVSLFYLIFKLLVSFKPSSKSFSEDLDKLKKEIALWSSNLVPWNEEEMELLSLNQEKKSTKKGLNRKAKGIFTTIFHEPLFAYNYKKYMGKGNQAILYAKTSHRTFSYLLNNDETLVFIDDKKVGLLKDGNLVGYENQTLAKVNSGETDTLNTSIVINDREVAGLVNPSNIDKVNPRAFSFVEKMDTKEEAVFLSMAILELVKRDVA